MKPASKRESDPPLFRANHLRRIFVLVAACLILFSGLLPVAPALAQGAARLVLSPLEIQSFPVLEFSLEAYDESGNFIDDLQPADLVIAEDGKPVTGFTMDLVEPGLQFSIAISPGAQLATRIDDQPQLELIRASLLQWANRQPAQGPSDFSFATNTGLQLIRSTDPADWVQALAEFNPDLERSEPNLFSLTTALDLAADQQVASRMKRAILFITPALTGDALTSLEDLTNRASQAGVRVFVWVPVSSLTTPPPDTTALQALADRTGGRFTLVAGRDTLPDLESWLTPLRRVYQAKFISSAQQSGAHRVSARLERGELRSADQALTYEITLKSPNPIFLNPPSSIERAWTEAESGAEAQLLPAEVPFTILVEFPDGYQRPLQATRLYVDNVLVLENTAPPFEEFVWDLSALSDSGAHTVRVEAVDMLGLSGSSIDTSVALVAPPRPTTGFLASISQRGLIAVIAVMVAGVVLALVLIGDNRLRSRGKKGDKRRMLDPVTQPVPIQQDIPRGRRPNQAEGGHWARSTQAATQPIPARLIRVTEDEHPIPGSLIPINRTEITIGSDPRQAVIVIEEGSVEKLHARLAQREDGSILLTDEGSVAGTWVNFIPVPRQGHILCHDDLIHLGRVRFRFELTNPPPTHQAVVEKIEERV